ncbi:MAG TPA: PAS domain S-box protein [Bacteroidota bacterium]
MEKSVRILILEDNQLDVQLMQRELQNARMSFLTVRTETLDEFTQQLELFLPDLILADYHLPTITAEEALAVARQHDPDVPFIVVTGTIGEEIAIETLKRGATDYVMKENLKRLGPAVLRALFESNERKAHLRAEEAYKDIMNRYREIVESASDIIFTIDYKGYFLHVNQAGLKASGYTIGELWKTRYLDLVLPEHRDRVKRHYMRQFLSRLPTSYVEYPFRTKLGEVRWYGQNAVPIFDGETIIGFHVICRDITEGKKE